MKGEEKMGEGRVGSVGGGRPLGVRRWEVAGEREVGEGEGNQER